MSEVLLVAREVSSQSGNGERDRPSQPRRSQRHLIPCADFFFLAERSKRNDPFTKRNQREQRTRQQVHRPRAHCQVRSQVLLDSPSNSGSHQDCHPPTCTSDRRRQVKPDTTTHCKQCGHDMKRSRCKAVGDLQWSVRCNKCKTFHTITLKLPEVQSDPCNNPGHG